MNWEQCARTGAWSSGLSILQMLLSEQSQRQNQCLSWVLAMTWHTWHISGCWRQPGQFKCLFYDTSFFCEGNDIWPFLSNKIPSRTPGVHWNCWQVFMRPKFLEGECWWWCGCSPCWAPHKHPSQHLCWGPERDIDGGQGGSKVPSSFSAGILQQEQLGFFLYYEILGVLERLQRDGDAPRQLCCLCQLS